MWYCSSLGYIKKIMCLKAPARVSLLVRVRFLKFLNFFSNFFLKKSQIFEIFDFFFQIFFKKNHRFFRFSSNMSPIFQIFIDHIILNTKVHFWKNFNILYLKKNKKKPFKKNAFRIRFWKTEELWDKWFF